MKTWQITLGAALLGACSAGEGNGVDGLPPGSSPLDPDPAEVELVSTETLHELDVGPEHFKFLRHTSEDGTETFMIEFSSPTWVTTGALETLRAADPELTLLEMYRALAPQGEEPHTALVEFHALQARQRGDDSVRTVDVDLDQPLEKSIASCNTHFDNATASIGETLLSSTVTRKNNLTGTVTACPSLNNQENCFQAALQAQVVLICNESTDPIGARPWWRFNGGAWQTNPLFQMILGNTNIGWHLPDSTPPDGEFFSPTQLLAIEGNSSSQLYHLRAALTQ